jgi:hypothetical protein
MKLSLEASQIRAGLEKSFEVEVESVSPSGLLVLATNEPPAELGDGLLDSSAQENTPLTFLLEANGTRQTLHASLVWADWSEGPNSARRLELIIDTTEQPGWLELSPPLAKG